MCTVYRPTLCHSHNFSHIYFYEQLSVQIQNNMAGYGKSDFMLLYNGSIWCAEQEDRNWLLINNVSGLVQEVGRGSPPEDTFQTCERKDCGGRR